MFDFTKTCNDFEKMTALDRNLVLTATSVKVLAGLHALNIPALDPVQTLVSFIIGSVVADGKVDEREYLLIYPALVKAFGDDFDYASVKESFKKDVEGKKGIHDYTEDVMTLLSYADEELRENVIALCLCVVTIDGKISLKEKKYIRRLCRA
ncbi:MAG: TerB family tellurite resistance protein [Candidatus Borkfalkiaceae bacterium]|nr:TerB family tellurite resistance protein [Christensenellaceae bacterium]